VPLRQAIGGASRKKRRFFPMGAPVDLPPDNLPPDVGPHATIQQTNAMIVQRYCALCGNTFESERKRGGQRIYCLVCEPPGWQVLKVPHQTRTKLRRRRW
jgi:hypothetical protein